MQRVDAAIRQAADEIVSKAIDKLSADMMGAVKTREVAHGDPGVGIDDQGHLCGGSTGHVA